MTFIVPVILELLLQFIRRLSLGHTRMRNEGAKKALPMWSLSPQISSSAMNAGSDSRALIGKGRNKQKHLVSPPLQSSDWLES